MQDKRELRAQYLSKRQNISKDEVKLKSRLIYTNLTSLNEFNIAKTILTYVSSKDNEVDTIALIEENLKIGKTILVPVACNNRILIWSHVLAVSELAPARFNILEPLPEFRRDTVPPDDSVAIVPGIAFTKTGYRIGYGGGYYDTFLTAHKGPKIGFAFEEQILPDFPLDRYDTPVDFVVTESSIYSGR